MLSHVFFCQVYYFEADIELFGYVVADASVDLAAVILHHGETPRKARGAAEVGRAVGFAPRIASARRDTVFLVVSCDIV